MRYEILVGGGWQTQIPRDTLKALLDEQPDGVSFVGKLGRTVMWRRAPRDEALITQIRDAIAINQERNFHATAEAVYDLLEGKGIV